MGPLTLGLTKLMQVCQWLLAAPEHILHQPLQLTDSLPLAEEVLAATGGLETLANSCPTGKDHWLSDTRPLLLFCFSEFAMSAFLGYLISISHELAQIFFQEVTVYANSLTCKDVTKGESQGLARGSIFFTLYINDLQERRCSKWITLADDIK